MVTLAIQNAVQLINSIIGNKTISFPGN